MKKDVGIQGYILKQKMSMGKNVWETLAKLVSYNMVKNKVSLKLTTLYENILFPLYLSLHNFNCFILVHHFISQ